MKKETRFWLEQAKEHYKDALYLYEGSRYSASVYFCHQALEKILKAAIVEFRNRVPFKIHQLERLAQETGLKFPKRWHEDLAEITRHSWKVRYPDFRRFTYTNKRKVTPTVEKTKEVYQWVLKKLNQK